LRLIRVSSLIALLVVVHCASAMAKDQGTGFRAGQFSAGGTHSCAIRADGTLACWGDDSKGQLDEVPSGTFTAVSAGGAHTCAIRSDGTLACWGDDSNGQLDEVPSGIFTAVSAGGAHTCAIRAPTDGDDDGGPLVCWGDDSKGQLETRAGEFVSVSAGGMHSCAIRANRHLACWGDDSKGQVSGAPGAWPVWHWFWQGDGPFFFAVAAGGAHTCAVRAFLGFLECWGDDSKGQLDEVPSGAFTTVSAGGAHACALRIFTGALSCWGDDSKGQLDQVPDGEFRAVSAGGAHTCAGPVVGPLECWGDNSFGQSQPEMVSAEPPEGTVGDPYSHRFETTPQSPAPTFSVVSGQLPDGLSLSPDGTLSGKPQIAGSQTFTVAASNGVTPDATQQVTLVVREAAQQQQVLQAAVESGLPAPVAGQSVNIDPVDGIVKTKCPGKDDFARIELAVQIPLSCLVDARNGTVDLTASKGSSGQTESADFWGGIFGVGQEAGDNKEAVMTLAGRLECEKRKLRKKNGRVMFRSRGQGRKLWGSGKGNYTTTGSHGAATVQGTTWLVADRCDGSTLFKVAEGTVWVQDFVKNIQVVLQAGDSYIARPPIPRLK
jgi:alpha-tubulin suppressor-like RCC1 family protein